MKHLKTFESFDQPIVNEELFGFSKNDKRKKFREELDKFIIAYSKRMKSPTESEIEAVMSDAESDGFEGKPGVTKSGDEMKLSYRPSKDISWRAGGRVFGSGE